MRSTQRKCLLAAAPPHRSRGSIRLPTPPSWPSCAQPVRSFSPSPISMNSVAAVPDSAPSAGRRATRTTPHASPAAPAAAPASPSQANLTLVALSEETGVSIRNPAANNNIVGIAPTQGLVSRAGVIPISFTQDRVGAYARTAADAALLLQVMAGYDADDPVTAASRAAYRAKVMPRRPQATGSPRRAWAWCDNS